MDDGIVFEREVFEQISGLHDRVVALPDEAHGPERRERTLDAMRSGVRLILGGELPLDDVGRRVGKPDVLVRAERRPDRGWAYQPVDVKHHRTVNVSTRPNAQAAVVADLDSVARAAAHPLDGWVAIDHKDDLLQLAHYQRMLVAAGHGSSVPAAGIIGKERHVTWHDLTEPRFRARWLAKDKPLEAALDRYDAEFAFRLDVLAAALGGAPIVEPVYTSECDACGWRNECVPEMVAADCLSLLPGYGYTEWYVHRAHGIRTRADIANLDRRSASLRDAYAQIGDLSANVDAARTVTEDTSVDDIVGRRSRRKIQVLAAHEVHTAADLLALDAAVLATADRSVGSLADAIDDARVSTRGLGAPHLRRNVASIVLPTVDVEIDIDMENALDGTVYLWGAYDGMTYRPAVSWEPASDLVEAQVFADFWDWVTTTRSDANAGGQTVAFYCWSQAAEITALTNGAKRAAQLLGRTDDPTEVAEFVASGELVDLLKVFRAHVITGGSAGLKRIAPHAGFQWRANDAAGDLSMLWHHEATTASDPAVQAQRRQRLLDYNEDDVRATAAIRAWLRRAHIPSVTTLDHA